MPSSPSGPGAGRAGTAVLDPAIRNRLQLFTEWRNDTDVQITAVGDVDMSTAHHFSTYVFNGAGDCRRLHLDMTQVTFFDCAGFSALCHIDERCNQANIRWIIEPAHYVSRVVAICDPLKGLPLSPAGETTSSL